MKNDKNNITRQRRAETGYRPAVDVVVNPEAGNGKVGRTGQAPRRRRRDYAKKIMNDPLVFTI